MCGDLAHEGRQAGTYTVTYRQTPRQTDRYTETETYMQTGRHTEIQKYTDTDTDTETCTDRQSDRQTGRQTYIQTGRQADRYRDAHTHTYIQTDNRQAGGRQQPPDRQAGRQAERGRRAVHRRMRAYRPHVRQAGGPQGSIWLLAPPAKSACHYFLYGDLAYSVVHARRSCMATCRQVLPVLFQAVGGLAYQKPLRPSLARWPTDSHAAKPGGWSAVRQVWGAVRTPAKHQVCCHVWYGNFACPMVAGHAGRQGGVHAGIGEPNHVLVCLVWPLNRPCAWPAHGWWHGWVWFCKIRPVDCVT